MKTEPLQTQADHATALARAEVLMDAKPGSSDEKELLHLAQRIESYESKIEAHLRQRPAKTS